MSEVAVEPPHWHPNHHDIGRSRPNELMQPFDEVEQRGASAAMTERARGLTTSQPRAHRSAASSAAGVALVDDVSVWTDLYDATKELAAKHHRVASPQDDGGVRSEHGTSERAL